MNELLKKYMRLVLNAEGVCHLEWAGEPEFTPADIETLKQIEKEITAPTSSATPP